MKIRTSEIQDKNEELLEQNEEIITQRDQIDAQHNAITDSLSRFQMERFRKLSPQAEAVPDLIPPYVWQIFTHKLEAF